MFRPRFIHFGGGVLLSGALLSATLGGAPTLEAQTDARTRQRAARVEAAEIPSERHTIPGPQAWAVARSNGFEFAPRTRAGQWIEGPRDGVHTLLATEDRAPLIELVRVDTLYLARVVGGNALVSPPPQGARTVTFGLFEGRRLAPGWSLEEVRMRGGVWRKRPEGSDASMEIDVTARPSQSGTAAVESIVLRGPAGKPWTDAFEGRRRFTLSGIEAWGTARGHGYEFHPVPERDGELLSDARDGVNTLLLDGANRCIRASVIARVVGGNMLVTCVPALGNGRRVSNEFDQTRDFRMFAGKSLAPGWIVRDVVVTGGIWVQRPEPGSTSLEFVYRLTKSGATEASAHVTRIVLEGPASAESWQDAFKVP